MPQITPNLWFDTQAEDAAEFYVSVFPNSKITDVAYYGEAGPRDAGMVLTVESYSTVSSSPGSTVARSSRSTRRSRS
jgi:predicted 3-demethylubiquinone-9 3-methyltransferase (glyoxalase superfamily)